MQLEARNVGETMAAGRSLRGRVIGTELHERSMNVAKRRDCLLATRDFNPDVPTVGCPAAQPLGLTLMNQFLIP